MLVDLPDGSLRMERHTHLWILPSSLLPKDDPLWSCKDVCHAFLAAYPALFLQSRALSCGDSPRTVPCLKVRREECYSMLGRNDSAPSLVPWSVLLYKHSTLLIHRTNQGHATLGEKCFISHICAFSPLRFCNVIDYLLSFPEPLWFSWDPENAWGNYILFPFWPVSACPFFPLLNFTLHPMPGYCLVLCSTC